MNINSLTWRCNKQVYTLPEYFNARFPLVKHMAAKERQRRLFPEGSRMSKKTPGVKAQIYRNAINAKRRA